MCWVRFSKEPRTLAQPGWHRVMKGTTVACGIFNLGMAMLSHCQPGRPQTRVSCIPLLWPPFWEKTRGLTHVPSSLSRDWVDGICWGYFFILEQHPNNTVIKDAINKGKWSHPSSGVLVWRWEGPALGGAGREDGQKVLNQRSTFQILCWKPMMSQTRRTPEYHF